MNPWLYDGDSRTVEAVIRVAISPTLAAHMRYSGI
jgi:hypothetical protein